MMLPEWRSHPLLRNRFLPEHPDDLQVIVHDGGPRLSDKPPELVWVTVTALDGEVFCGRVLNQPQGLVTVKLGDEIEFVAPAADHHPILVKRKYLEERADWVIHSCKSCGLSELFDAPSDLIRRLFPDCAGDESVECFTSICPLCRGVQLVMRKGLEIE
jgi:hypothetical protein